MIFYYIRVYLEKHEQKSVLWYNRYSQVVVML